MSTKNFDNENTARAYADPAAEREEREKRRRARKRKRIINRIFGFFLTTGVLFGVCGLALEYVLIKGPSPALRDTFAMTMAETRRFTFIPYIFMTREEGDSYLNRRTEVNGDVTTDTSLIKIGANATVGSEVTAEEQDMRFVDEDGDGLIINEIKGSGYSGYMMVILDPTRIYLGTPIDNADNPFGSFGLPLDAMCEQYGAVAGINAGGFSDDGGGGSGGWPQGITVVQGRHYNYSTGYDRFAGFDADGILHVGYFSSEDVIAANIQNGVSFGPLLIVNGEIMYDEIAVSGVNPRTAIGQRADGIVLMLVIDGRQLHSVGATYSDVVDIMLDYGAVNACNMDGGSSTSMWYQGDYVNSCSSQDGKSRYLPDAWLFK